MTDLVDKIIAWETGQMTSRAEVIAFFQELIDNDMAWKLQGSYGRMVKALIDTGNCHPKQQDS